MANLKHYNLTQTAQGGQQWTEESQGNSGAMSLQQMLQAPCISNKPKPEPQNNPVISTDPCVTYTNN